MLISRLRLVTFDVTDTLLKFRNAPGQQYGEIGAMYGVLVDNSSLASNFKAHFVKMNQEHPNFGLKTGLDWQTWWKTIVKRTFEDSKIMNADDKKLEAIATHLIDAYKTSACWQHCYGVPGLLSYIRSKRIPMGVISNFDPRLNHILTNLKLRHYFQFVLTSYEAGTQKPDTQIFTEALNVSNLKDLKPEECLHIGDKITLDYYGAKNSGWNAALINDKKFEDIKEKYPDIDENHIFPSLYHLHRHFLLTSDDKISSHSL